MSSRQAMTAATSGFLYPKTGDLARQFLRQGFLNGLTALANATVNGFPMIMISGSSDRAIVDLQQGDYEELDQMESGKALCQSSISR